MSTITYEHIRDARTFLSKYLSQTRLQGAPSVSRVANAEVALKLESEQPTGSFKVRGALHALAVNLQRGKIAGVVTASTGNHGAAVAYAASLLHVPCTVFLPVKPNPTKRSRIIELGATVREAGWNLSEAAVHAAAHAEQDGMFFLNDATDPDLPAGASTVLRAKYLSRGLKPMPLSCRWATPLSPGELPQQSDTCDRRFAS